jgi:hypothetical protein
VFDLFGNDRLAKWKQIRDQIEIELDPLQTVSDLWARAPLVNPFLDHSNAESWPDPWHLIMDDRYDDLAICLGMLYTLKLTQRFMGSRYEIHMSINSHKKESLYFLVVNGESVLNLCYRKVFTIDELKDIDSNIIWSL